MAKKKQSKTAEDVALDRELAALHDAQAACQVLLRDVPHQNGCKHFGTNPPLVYREDCTCIRKLATDLEFRLAQQLETDEYVPTNYFNGEGKVIARL